MVTSGDGLIYNVARARMLSATFRWTDPDKYAVIYDTSYVFDENHKTSDDVQNAIAATGMPVIHGSIQVPGLFVSANSWAGSQPPEFSGEVWTKAIGALVFVRFFGSIAEVTDPTKYELIACMTTFLGGPIYPDGSPFSLTFDQSNGQQGWFRP